MPDSYNDNDAHNDHDVLTALKQQVQHHHEQITQLDAHDRETLITLTRMDQNIEGLRQSHASIMATIHSIEAQRAIDQQRTEDRLVGLDDKMDQRLDNLQGHFDESFTSMRHDVVDEMARKEAALPQWAKVRMLKISIVVAVIAIGVSIVEAFHVHGL
jgi:phage shock protein A